MGDQRAKFKMAGHGHGCFLYPLRPAAKEASQECLRPGDAESCRAGRLQSARQAGESGHLPILGTETWRSGQDAQQASHFFPVVSCPDDGGQLLQEFLFSRFGVLEEGGSGQESFQHSDRGPRLRAQDGGAKPRVVAVSRGQSDQRLKAAGVLVIPQAEGQLECHAGGRFLYTPGQLRGENGESIRQAEGMLAHAGMSVVERGPHHGRLQNVEAFERIKSVQASLR